MPLNIQSRCMNAADKNITIAFINMNNAIYKFLLIEEIGKLHGLSNALNICCSRRLK